MSRMNPESSNVELMSPRTLATLDQVSNALTEWRENKSSHGPNIPDDIWLAIFELAKTYPSSGLRSLFQLSTAQYKNKAEQLLKPAPAPQPVEALVEPDPTALVEEDEVTLCEVKSLHKPQVLPESTGCMVVELHKPDGCVMKFHITMTQLRETLKQFLGEEK